jgi:hypothetical protein
MQIYTIAIMSMNRLLGTTNSISILNYNNQYGNSQITILISNKDREYVLAQDQLGGRSNIDITSLNKPGS